MKKISLVFFIFWVVSCAVLSKNKTSQKEADKPAPAALQNKNEEKSKKTQIPKEGKEQQSKPAESSIKEKNVRIKSKEHIEEYIEEHISGNLTSSHKKTERQIKLPPPQPDETKKTDKKKSEMLRGEIVSFSNKRIAGEDQHAPSALQESPAKFIVLNFQNADIRDVIVTIGDLLKINYIIDPAVKGSITIHTSEKIPIEEAYSVFEQILAVNGVSLVKKGKLYRFIPAKEAIREPIETYIGRDNSIIPSEDRIIFQIIPINYLPASTLHGILTPLLTKNGAFIDIPGPNRLSIIESASNIKRLIDIINALDVNMFDKIQVKLYEVKHADSLALIKELTEIFSSMGYGKESKQLLKFIDLPRLKSILVINAFPKLFPTIDYWIKKLDISLKSVEVKLLPVKYLEGKDIGNLTKELETIFSALGYVGAKGKGKGNAKEGHILDFVSISRLNSILVINSYPDVFSKIEEWLERLDQPPTGEGVMKIYVYYVQYSEAGNIASILNMLFVEEARKDEYRKKNVEKKKTVEKKGEKGKKGKKKPSKELPEIPSEVISLSSDVEGEINIIADDTTNSLIIRTNPRNYPVILETIKKLDIMPLQVLIEVIIAELQLDDSTRYGLEWALKKDKSTQYGISSSAGGKIPDLSAAAAGQTGIQGLGFFIHKSDELLGMLQAFSRDSKLEVLSSPMLLTSENQPASIDIVNQIPIETKTVDPATNVTATTIQYKDVGIKLNVVPKINMNKYISLDLSQEVSQVVGEFVSGSAAPPIFSRHTKTNVVIKDKQTLVIAGLMERRGNRASEGIPGFAKLPFLGCLFGSKSNSKTKTELLIFITPHVIADMKEADKLTNDFQNKLKMLNIQLKNGHKGNNLLMMN